MSFRTLKKLYLKIVQVFYIKKPFMYAPDVFISLYIYTFPYWVGLKSIGKSEKISVYNANLSNWIRL